MPKREVPLSILSPPYHICDELWERGRSHSVFVIEGLEVKIILTDFLLCRGGGPVAVL